MVSKVVFFYIKYKKYQYVVCYSDALALHALCLHDYVTSDRMLKNMECQITCSANKCLILTCFCVRMVVCLYACEQ